MGHADRRPLQRLIAAGYAASKRVGSDGTEVCWITNGGKAYLNLTSECSVILAALIYGPQLRAGQCGPLQNDPIPVSASPLIQRR
jgi:hypothetical protein